MTTHCELKSISRRSVCHGSAAIGHFWPPGRSCAARLTPTPAARPLPQTPLPEQPLKFSYAELAGSEGAGESVAAGEMEMMRYIGANWPKYRDLWHEMRGGSELKLSFSFPAFFLTVFWMLYRKLYAQAFAVIGLGFAFSFVAPKRVWLFNIATSAAFGFFGKSLVVQRAMKTVVNIKNMGLSNGEAALRIEKAGGTNLFAPIAMSIVFFVFGLIAGAAVVAKKAIAEKAPSAVMRKI
jgi:hypothetical protein